MANSPVSRPGAFVPVTPQPAPPGGGPERRGPGGAGPGGRPPLAQCGNRPASAQSSRSPQRAQVPQRTPASNNAAHLALGPSTANLPIPTPYPGPSTAGLPNPKPWAGSAGAARPSGAGQGRPSAHNPAAAALPPALGRPQPMQPHSAIQRPASTHAHQLAKLQTGIAHVQQLAAQSRRQLADAQMAQTAAGRMNKVLTSLPPRKIDDLSPQNFERVLKAMGVPDHRLQGMGAALAHNWHQMRRRYPDPHAMAHQMKFNTAGFLQQMLTPRPGLHAASAARPAAPVSPHAQLAHAFAAAYPASLLKQMSEIPGNTQAFIKPLQMLGLHDAATRAGDTPLHFNYESIHRALEGFAANKGMSVQQALTNWIAHDPQEFVSVMLRHQNGGDSDSSLEALKSVPSTPTNLPPSAEPDVAPAAVRTPPRRQAAAA
jgi:hypothetical protein